MATHPGHVEPESEEVKFYAPNLKNPQLQETEDEAMRLFKKRQRDQLDELEHRKAEQARLEKQAKANA